MGSAKKVFSGVLWSVLTNVFAALSGFIITPLLINYFGRSEYGIIALAGSINAYMGLMDLGLSSTNVRFFSNWLSKGDTARVRKLMQTCTAFYGVVGIINALILIVAYFYTDQIFNVTPYQDGILKNMVIVLAVTAFINWYTSCFGQLISATENVAWVQKLSILTRILTIIAVVITLVFKLSIFQYFVASILAGLLVLPMTIQKVRKEVPCISFLAKFDLTTFKEILPYSLAVFSFGIFQSVFHNSRTLILGMQGTVEYVTDYGVMAALAGLVSTVSGVFVGALLPSSSRVVAQGDQDAYYRVAYQGTKLISIALCFCAFGLMTIDKDLIMVYVGKDYVRLAPWLNMWLIATLTSHNSAISSLILAGTKLKALSYTSAFSAVIGILCCWFLVPLFESGGIVIGYIVYCYSQISFFYFYYWPKKMQINSWKVFTESFIPFVAIGALLSYVLTIVPHTDNHWINIFIFGLLFALLYLMIVWFIAKKEDRRLVLGLIRK